METNLSRSLLWKRLWRESTDVLAARGNRVRMMLAILILAAAALPELLFLQIFGVIAAGTSPDASDAILVLQMLGYVVLSVAYLIGVLIPLLYGLLRLAERMEAEEETVLSDLFCAFGGAEHFRRALVCGWYLAAPPAILIAAAETMVDRLTGLAGGNAWGVVPAALAAVLADLLLLILLLGWFAAPYTVLRREPGKRVRMRAARRVGAWYWLRFLPHLILSVLTLLICFVADILPRMLIIYFRLCREVLIIPEERLS